MHFKITIQNGSYSVIQSALASFEVQYKKGKAGILKFQVANFIFACLSQPNTKLTVFVCYPLEAF